MTVQWPMWLGGDGHHARWRGRDQQVGQQPDEVEMTEVVRLECRLEAVVGEWMRRAKHAGVENKNIQRTVPDMDRHKRHITGSLT